MNLDALKSYKVNEAYTTGAIIELDNAPGVEFRVVLPGKHNRAYISAVYDLVDIRLGDGSEDQEVELKTSLVATRDAQEAAFMAHCLKSIDGEPVPEDFLEQYPDAVEELMRKANEMLQELEGGAERAAKKSAISSSGNIAGVIG